MNENWIAVDSTAADSVAYNENDGTLSVRFNSGSVYEYHSVPEEVFEDLLDSDSVGQFLNENVVNNYGYTQVR